MARPGASLAQTTLVLESWRNYDRTAWQEEIVPAFEAAHPGIELRSRPSAPADYKAGLTAWLRAGTAGDLIARRPFDASLALYEGWPAAILGYNNIGPHYWKGEEGRRALVRGEQRLTDEPWVAPCGTLARWRRYLGGGYETRCYRESQDLFVRGGAAVFPAGSSEIAGFRARAGFELDAFRPPVREAGDACYVSDHIDMAIGLNAASPNREAAQVFLNWIATAEFASLYAAALPGFFPLSDHPVESDDPLVRSFPSWCRDCHSTVRFAPSFLSRGAPDLERESWNAAVLAIAGAAAAENIAAWLHGVLAGRRAPRTGLR